MDWLTSLNDWDSHHAATARPMLAQMALVVDLSPGQGVPPAVCKPSADPTFGSDQTSAVSAGSREAAAIKTTLAAATQGLKGLQALLRADTPLPTSG